MKIKGEKNKYTIQEYSEYWIKMKTVVFKPEIIEDYNNMLENYINPFLGNIALQGLTIKRLNEYFMYLKQEKQKDYNTLRKHRDLLGIMLNTAVEEGKLLENIILKLDRAEMRAKSREVHDIGKIRFLLRKVKGHTLDLTSYLGGGREENKRLKYSNEKLEQEVKVLQERNQQLEQEVEEGNAKMDLMQERYLKLLKETEALIAKVKELEQNNGYNKDLYKLAIEMVKKHDDGKVLHREAAIAELKTYPLVLDFINTTRFKLTPTSLITLYDKAIQLVGEEYNLTINDIRANKTRERLGLKTKFKRNNQYCNL